MFTEHIAHHELQTALSLKVENSAKEAQKMVKSVCDDNVVTLKTV